MHTDLCTLIKLPPSYLIEGNMCHFFSDLNPMVKVLRKIHMVWQFGSNLKSYDVSVYKFQNIHFVVESHNYFNEQNLI